MDRPRICVLCGAFLPKGHTICVLCGARLCCRETTRDQAYMVKTNPPSSQRTNQTAKPLTL